MAKTPAGEAQVAAAINNIQAGVGETGDAIAPAEGMPEALSMADILAEFELSPQTLADDDKTPEGTKTPEKGQDASPGTTDGKETKPDTEADPLLPQFADFGKKILEEWEENPSQVAVDFFQQMNADQQQEFIRQVTGQAAQKQAQSAQLPQGYQPQGELEATIMPFVPEIQNLPAIREQIASVTGAVTNGVEMANFGASHAHVLEAKLNAIAEFLGLTLPDVDLAKVVAEAKKAGNFKKAADNLLGADLKKIVAGKRQAQKQRPLESSGDASNVLMVKNGAKATDILKMILEQA